MEEAPQETPLTPLILQRARRAPVVIQPIARPTGSSRYGLDPNVMDMAPDVIHPTSNTDFEAIAKMRAAIRERQMEFVRSQPTEPQQDPMNVQVEEPPIPLNLPSRESIENARRRQLDYASIHSRNATALNEEQQLLFDSYGIDTTHLMQPMNVEAKPTATPELLQDFLERFSQFQPISHILDIPMDKQYLFMSAFRPDSVSFDIAYIKENDTKMANMKLDTQDALSMTLNAAQVWNELPLPRRQLLLSKTEDMETAMDEAINETIRHVSEGKIQFDDRICREAMIAIDAFMMSAEIDEDYERKPSAEDDERKPSAEDDTMEISVEEAERQVREAFLHRNQRIREEQARAEQERLQAEMQNMEMQRQEAQRIKDEQFHQEMQRRNEERAQEAYVAEEARKIERYNDPNNRIKVKPTRIGESEHKISNYFNEQQSERQKRPMLEVRMDRTIDGATFRFHTDSQQETLVRRIGDFNLLMNESILRNVHNPRDRPTLFVQDDELYNAGFKPSEVDSDRSIAIVAMFLGLIYKDELSDDTKKALDIQSQWTLRYLSDVRVGDESFLLKDMLRRDYDYGGPHARDKMLERMVSLCKPIQVTDNRPNKVPINIRYKQQQYEKVLRALCMIYREDMFQETFTNTYRQRAAEIRRRELEEEGID